MDQHSVQSLPLNLRNFTFLGKRPDLAVWTDRCC